MKTKIRNSNKEDLLKIVVCCNFHTIPEHNNSGNEVILAAIKERDEAYKVLNDKYGMNLLEIEETTTEMHKQELGRAYERSACPSCPYSQGKEATVETFMNKGLCPEGGRSKTDNKKCHYLPQTLTDCTLNELILSR